MLLRHWRIHTVAVLAHAASLLVVSGFLREPFSPPELRQQDSRLVLPVAPSSHAGMTGRIAGRIAGRSAAVTGPLDEADAHFAMLFDPRFALHQLVLRILVMVECRLGRPQMALGISGSCKDAKVKSPSGPIRHSATGINTSEMNAHIWVLPQSQK